MLTDVGSVDDWLREAPADSTTAEARTWAKAQRKLALEARLEDIQRFLRPGVALEAVLADGELSFLMDSQVVIDRVFVNADEAPFIFAQWDTVARTFNVTDKTKAKALVDALRKLIPGNNPALVQQILDLRDELQSLDEALAEAETEINQLLYQAYDLTKAERALVERR